MVRYDLIRLCMVIVFYAIYKILYIGGEKMNDVDMLYERLEILEGSKLIEPNVTEQVKKIILLLFQRNKPIDTEKMEMFTTHIAMAIQRIINGEREKPLDDEVLRDLKEEEVYTEAEKFAQDIYKNIDVEFPDAEKGYLVAHLCNLFL